MPAACCTHIQRPPMNRLGLFIILLSAALLGRGALADLPTTTAALHDRLVQQYLDGTWDDLAKELVADAKSIATLPAERKADVEYIRRTLNESRPPWWKSCKAGAKVHFRPVVWGHALSAGFTSGTKQNINLTFRNGVASVELTWDASQMDDPAIDGELAFTKGENNLLAVWTQLGTAESWSNIPPRFQLSLKEDEKTALTHYIDFRGNVTAAYYATPRPAVGAVAGDFRVEPRI